jgi:outer membrane protein OmpA-like peptidoglycan-associated protein
MKYKNYKLYISIFILCACVCGGCRSNKDGLGGDGISPTVLPGDFGLGARIEDGIRVSASEFNPQPVMFAYDSYRINPADKYKVAQVGAFMQQNRDVRLVVEGHCDERGSREYNVSLGEHRALAIRAALISDDGIASKRIQTRPYGEEKPVDGRHNESAWRQNRRGEFALYR